VGSNENSRALSDAVLSEICEEFPRFRIIPKQGNWLSRAIDVALRVITLGGQSSYMTRYHTVIGDTLYVPASWTNMADADRAILLRHERVHLRQRRRLTFAGMAFVYLVPWLPLGLAYGRARLEWEAYTETLRATAELKGLEAATSPALRDHILARFTGPDYGWMWPFPTSLRRWYDDAIGRLPQHTPTGQPESANIPNNRQ
jgi:hypothetical protein